MKPFVLFVAFCSLLCGCNQSRQIDWQYEKVEMHDETWHTNQFGKIPSYSVFQQYRQPAKGEDILKTYLELENENTPADVLRTIGSEGWELAWMSPDQKEFFVKRPRSKTGSFYVQEKFKDP